MCLNKPFAAMSDEEINYSAYRSWLPFTDIMKKHDGTDYSPTTLCCTTAVQVLTSTAPALVFWRPYANWNLAAPVGDHEAVSANWSI